MKKIKDIIDKYKDTIVFMTFLSIILLSMFSFEKIDVEYDCIIIDETKIFVGHSTWFDIFRGINKVYSPGYIVDANDNVEIMRWTHAILPKNCKLRIID